MAILAVCMVSCGGKKEDNGDKDQNITITPESTTVEGDLGDCYTVIDRNYKVIDKIGKKVTIELERTQEDLPFDLDYLEINYFNGSDHNEKDEIRVGFGIEFLDEDGNIIGKVNANDGWNKEGKDCISLAKLKPGKKGSITFEIGWDIELKNVRKFRVTSAYEEKEANPYVSSSSSSSSSSEDNDDDSEDNDISGSTSSLSSSSSSSHSSADIDKFLDSYEKLVDKYISYAKKMNAGDMSGALDDYADIMQETQELSGKLNGMQGNMSGAQLARYTRINSKMLKAANQMK